MATLQRSPGSPKSHTLRWPLEAAAAHAAVGLLRALPERASLALGGAIGRGYHALDTHYRRLARANTRLVFPDWPEDERHALLVKSFTELGRCAAEWARLPALSGDEILERVGFDGIGNLEGALAVGRGALVVTGHLGFWEIILRSISARMRDAEITAVGRELPNPRLQSMVAKRRGLGGSEPLPQDARAILRALRRNAAVGVLADHYLSKRRGGVLEPFLGLQAWSNPGPATLALRAGCPLLVAHAYRMDDGRHRVSVSAPLSLPAGEDRQENIAAATALINAELGDLVRRRPESWLWANHRWRASPDIAGDRYPSRRQGRRS